MSPALSPAIASDYAAAEFDALPADSIIVLTERQWAEAYEPYIVASNIAIRLLARSKPEMVDLARELMADDDLATLKGMREVLEFGEGLISNLKSPMSAATLRLLAACCVVEAEEEAAGGAS